MKEIIAKRGSYGCIKHTSGSNLTTEQPESYYSGMIAAEMKYCTVLTPGAQIHLLRKPQPPVMPS